MDDLFALLLFILVLIPIIIIVLLIKILNRQNHQHEETAVILTQLEQLIEKQNKHVEELLHKLQPSHFEKTSPPEYEKPKPESKIIPETGSSKQKSETKASTLKTQTTTPLNVQKTEASRQTPSNAWQSKTETSYEPTRFESAAKKILKEIWNWIIVGEGHRSKDTSIEYAVASNWLLRIGVLILVTGIGFFLKYSIDSGLLGEKARVALTVLAGLGMITGGVQWLGGRYHLLSQGLLGGGITVLYFSVFAAFSFYHLLSAYPAFALMILVTASASALAIWMNSMLVAIFAIIGGYCTPVLLSTGQVNFTGLFAYLLLLGIGILAINWYKHWHLLNFLSFIFNYLLFFGAMEKYQTHYFWNVFPFLIAFFVLYSTMVFLFCLINRERSTLLDLLALIINAAIFFITARHLILDLYEPIWVALLTVTLTAFYIAHVYYCLVKRISDRDLMLSFIGLAAFFLTITLPLLFSDQWITVSWSLQALTMLWLSGKMRSAFLQQAAYIIYLIVVIRFCFIDLPGQYGSMISVEQSLMGFLLGLAKRLLSFGIPIGSLAAAYFLIEKPATSATMACLPDTDVPLVFKNNRLLQVVMVIVSLMLFVVLQLELYRSFGYLYPPLQLPMLTLVWLAMCLLLLWRFVVTQTHWLLIAMQIFLAGALLKLLFIDLPSWHITMGHFFSDTSIWTLRYSGSYNLQFFLMRLLDFAAMIGFLLLAYRSLVGFDLQNLRNWFGGGALGLIFIFLSLEVNSALYQFIPGFRSGGVSILWSIFALLLIFFGIQRQFRQLRLIGLALFAVVAWKVFFVDLARLEQIYRILAFIVLGIVVLGGAFFYMRYQQTFIGNNTQEKTS